MISNNIAVEVDQISKIYRLGIKDKTYDSFGRTVLEFIKSPIHNYRKHRSLYRFDEVVGKNGSDTSDEQDDILWALKGISFQVKKGEVIGIIGRNGAGKSTILKILSRITEPTSGRAIIQGSASCLLEVGTGFHQELTGRENIYLNGTVLGMRKREIDQKFDAIVDFSGVGRFLDTPIKRYSSGMKVRLAFSVASHLDPEILIVDEVLAVGDAAFQKKCLSKMETIGSEGKTVIFVSHDMSAIGRLCKRIILLDSGRILLDGPAVDVIRSYLKSGQLVPEVREWNEIKDAPGNDIVRLRAVRILNEESQPAATINIDQPIDIEIEYEIFKPGYTFLPHFSLNNQDGVCVFVGLDQDIDWQNRVRPKGRYKSVARIPGNLLSEGTMSIGPAMRTLDPDLLHFYEENAVSFEIIDSNERGTVRGGWTKKIPGVVRPLLSWRTEFKG